MKALASRLYFFVQRPSVFKEVDMRC